jgi:hypothetical protein
MALRMTSTFDLSELRVVPTQEIVLALMAGELIAAIRSETGWRPINEVKKVCALLKAQGYRLKLDEQIGAYSAERVS